jgi:xylobiose transport system permease protein
VTKSTDQSRRTGPSVGRPGVAWALPGVLYFAFFAVLPMVLVAYLSFTEWNGLGTPKFVGTDNWERLFSDSLMGQSLWLAFLLTALTWVVQTPLALLIGVWSAGYQRNRALLSAVYFLPLLLSSVAISLLWRTLIDPNFGLPAQIGSWVGIDSIDLIGQSDTALYTLVFVATWQFVPLHSLLYQGGARQIPQSLYDAASIDGAGRIRQFFHITLPQLRNTITTSSILMVVGALTFFDTVLIMTQGGPGTDTTITPYLMYQTGFQSYEMGYGSTIAFVLVIMATTASLVLVKMTGFGAMRSTREGM